MMLCLSSYSRTSYRCSTDNCITVQGKILVGKKLANLVNREPFSKILFFSPIFTDTPKTHMAHTLTVAYSSNFSSPIAFTCMVCQNFPLPNISCLWYDTECICRCCCRKLKRKLNRRSWKRKDVNTQLMLTCQERCIPHMNYNMG